MDDWQYQQQDAPPRAVVDFTGTIAPCPACGAEAYLQASPGGYMRVRYRCEHGLISMEGMTDAEGLDAWRTVDDIQREAFIAGWKSGWYVRDNAIEDYPAEEAYEQWRQGRDG